VTTEPLGLVANLLYALGFALWTGVVVVVFVQIIPEVKRRQFKRMLDAPACVVGEAGIPVTVVSSPALRATLT
jgi:hypothetical protein